MANEFKHKSVGDELSRANWENKDTHCTGNDEKGDILIFNGVNWVGLPHGILGQILQSGGHGELPSFVTPPVAMQSKIIASTRVLTAASGDVSYTGVGFQPSVIIAFSADPVNSWHGIGFSDSAKNCYSMIWYGQYNAGQMSAVLINAYEGSGAWQTCIVKSYDADGFTLTWTKTGSPTGTPSLYFLCLK
jgi:hypothetical protein